MTSNNKIIALQMIDVPLIKLKEWKDLLQKEGINSKGLVLKDIEKVMNDSESYYKRQ